MQGYIARNSKIPMMIPMPTIPGNPRNCYKNFSMYPCIDISSSDTSGYVYMMGCSITVL